MDTSLLAAVASGFVLAVCAPWIVRTMPRAHGLVLALLPGLLAIFFGVRLGTLSESSASSAMRIPWLSGLDIQLSFAADGLSLLLGLLIAGVGAPVMLYASHYLRGHSDLGRFYVAMLSFMASMLGVVFADNVVLLYVFWELTSIGSFFLIGFEHDRSQARTAALQALLVTSGGGLALLAGLLLLGHVGGSYEMSTLLERGSVVANDPRAPAILGLILLGAFTKSAQFPFHFWLPNAMAAPAAVSAYLHSATMVKAGVYLLARLSPVLGGIDGWFPALTMIGGTTAVLGAWLAFRESHLKRILAYSTISSLGLLVMLLGIGTEAAIVAAVTYLVAHVCYKASLFLIAGIIDYETGVHEAERLSGLMRVMPVAAIASLLAAFSMAGFPPLLGYLGKEELLGVVRDAPLRPLVLTSVVAISSVLTIAVAILAGIKPFVGTLEPTPRPPHRSPWGMLFGPCVLAGCSLLFGIMPSLLNEFALSPAASAVLDEPVEVSLRLWHGFNPVLAISLVSFVVGISLFLARRPLGRIVRPIDELSAWGPDRWYRWSLRAMVFTARIQTRVLQSGHLSRYLLTVIVTATVLAAGTYFVYGQHVPISTSWSQNLRIHELVIAGLTLVATIAAVLSRSQLGAIAAMGVVGYGVAMQFVIFSAPDLAMTQFVVETLTVILFVLAFHHFPPVVKRSRTKTRIRDALVAVTVGGLMTMLVLIADEVQIAERISEYYVENSLDAGHGRNIVNVILVDFRVIDTLGEITVLAIAGIGIHAILKLRITSKSPGGDA